MGKRLTSTEILGPKLQRARNTKMRETPDCRQPYLERALSYLPFQRVKNYVLFSLAWAPGTPNIGRKCPAQLLHKS